MVDSLVKVTSLIHLDLIDKEVCKRDERSDLFYYSIFDGSALLVSYAILGFQNLVWCKRDSA